MEVYRIVLGKYANDLRASGRAARWNSNDVQVVYTSASQSLACLENVVHRNSMGLNAFFKVMYLEMPDNLKIDVVDRDQLPYHWKSFEALHFTQRIGDAWASAMSSAVLKVPSSIIATEFNFLLNPLHPDFKRIKLLKSDPFVFDERIKI